MAVGTSTNDESTQVSGEFEPKLEQPKKSLDNASANDDTTDQAHTHDPEKTAPTPASSPNTTDPEQPDNEKNQTSAIVSDPKTDDTTHEDESKYLHGPKLAILSIGLCLTTFVIALDNTIIATAIPKITTVFNSLEDCTRTSM
ncbi:hypothetical protein J4E91_006559 [Alternaria rosae]|nr:hypothetical protein J4E91_006559 [Alternaria rosae]